MMTGRRRNELNSLTDCLVYAGLVGAGFAWLEDILYIGGGESVSDSLATAALRLIMGPFAHSLFTTMFGIGVYFALQQRNAVAKALLRPDRLRRRGDHAWAVERLVAAERRGVLPDLPVLDGAGLRGWRSCSASPAGGGSSESSPRSCRAWWRRAWSPPTRRPGWARSAVGSRRSATAKQFGGKPAAKSVKKFAAQVVELAFVRDRIDRGFGDQRVLALQQEEVNEVAAARAAAPALQAAGRVPGSWPLVRRRIPAPAVADADLERHVERVGVAHLLTDQRLEGVPLARRDLEQQLVVHLQQHP